MRIELAMLQMLYLEKLDVIIRQSALLYSSPP